MTDLQAIVLATFSVAIISVGLWSLRRAMTEPDAEPGGEDQLEFERRFIANESLPYLCDTCGHERCPPSCEG